MTVFYIKNMVCPRCIAAVQGIFTELGLNPVEVKLGEAKVSENEISSDSLSKLAYKLAGEGFELLEDRASKLVNGVKSSVIDLVYGRIEQPVINLSEYLSRTLGEPYHVLSELFSSSEGRTIDKFHIAVRIERAKELLSYGDMSVAEISELLGYSSTSHLSSQFKQVTGETPSDFRRKHSHTRKSLDRI